MEYISSSLYNNRVADGRLNDMWSIGILICILITNENPYRNTIYNIQNQYGYKPTSKVEYINSNYWNIFNKEFDKLEFNNSRDQFIYKYNLRKLINILLTKDELIRYTSITELCDKLPLTNNEVQYNKTNNINLYDIILENHPFCEIIANLN